MSKRKGYTNAAIPMKTLRDALADFMISNRTASHERIVERGISVLDDGLFEQYAAEFKGYIVANSIPPAEEIVRDKTGRDAKTGLPDDPKPEPKPEKKKKTDADFAREDQAIMDTYFKALGGLTFTQYIAHEERGSARAKAARVLVSKGSYRLSDKLGKLNARDRKVIYSAM